jgi:protein-tyrosine kinase
MIKIKKKENQAKLSETKQGPREQGRKEQAAESPVSIKDDSHLPMKTDKEIHLPMISLHEVSREAKEKIGWVSPIYHTSRHVALDVDKIYANRCVAFRHHSPEIERYRVLRSHILRHTGKQGGVTVMVTSALPGEGKTLTAINLSFAFAQEFMHTSLLVDCDLKQQRIHEVLGYHSEKGVIDHLIDDEPISDLIVWPGVEKLVVISGGRKLAAGGELIGSPKMRTLVENLKGRYPERYVFLDAPPLLSGADTLALIPLVDYVLVVVQAGRTSIDDVKKAVRMIPQEKVLGLVLNREHSV